MKRHWLIPVGVSLAIIVFVITGILIPAGVFKKINPHFTGSLVELALPVAGPEDITIDDKAGVAFISVEDRRANLTGHPVAGAILLLDLNQPEFTRTLAIRLPDFHPHGISLWRNDADELFLFAVNHRQNNSVHTVEKFLWKKDSLIHQETFEDSEQMTSPNDLVAVGERSFYVTNDHGYGEKGLARKLEEYLQRSISYVNYYDGTAFRKVTNGIAYANGINVSKDQRQVFVASTTGRKVLIYNRAATGDLTLADEISVNTGVDNIEVDEAGALWIGCHPQMLKYVAYAADSTERSPSQVIRITPAQDGSHLVEEIFLNDGSYSGSSVGAVYKNLLLIGSVYEKSILIGSIN